MDKLRQIHNNCKREFLQRWVWRDSVVLDCGCGRGGDLWKWRGLNVRLFAIDPDEEALVEARSRAETSNTNVFFLGQGDIRQAAFAGPYDVVCYNFSIHYIFETPEIFKSSIKAIACALKPGGLLLGITPDKMRAEMMADENGKYMDSLGNNFEIWNGRRRLMVQLADGPFYADGPRDEPLLDAQQLIEALKAVGLELLIWEPMVDRPNGYISDLYSKFVFKKNT